MNSVKKQINSALPGAPNVVYNPRASEANMDILAMVYVEVHDVITMLKEDMIRKHGREFLNEINSK
jgi:hypothetical protein